MVMTGDGKHGIVLYTHMTGMMIEMITGYFFEKMGCGDQVA